MTKTRNNPWLHRYAVVVAFLTFLLIVAGALVTSNDAGLSVPDWPTSFGRFGMPRMVGGVVYEHGHRMIAGVVGILTILLAIWLWRKESRRWLVKLGFVAVLAVVAQAILGGATVLLDLPVTVSVGHATLGQIFFCIMVCIALFTGSNWNWDEPKIRDDSSLSVRHLTAVTTGVILLQLILGAAFRHSGIGLLPHIIGAVVVTVCVGWVVVKVFTRFAREPRLMRFALLLASLLVAQIFLGVGSYIEKMAELKVPQPLPWAIAVTTTHVAVGALVLMASLLLTLEAHRTLGATQLKTSAQPASVPERATL